MAASNPAASELDSMSKYAFVLEPSSHAELSASSAERWMTCPGSVALSAGLPNVSSAFAAQGSAGHYIGAECLKDGGSPRRWLGKVALVEGHEVELDEELIEAVQEYLDDCEEDTQEGDVVFIEQSFTPALKKLHPKFGGSGDRVRWRPSTRQMRVTDLKLGAGVPVDVDENKQLKKYSLGALLSNPQFNAEEIELRVVQPRCDHEAGRCRSYKFPAFDLIDFSADLVEAAHRTEEFGADLVPSKKACKFCPAAAANKCPAIEQHTHALVAADFSPVSIEKYSKDQIAEFLRMAPLVEARISQVREFAYNRACAGEQFPGWKVVEKRATRKWTDEDTAAAQFGTIPGAMKEPVLRSPAQLEKIIGKKKFAMIVDALDLVSKESSGLTLAPEDDPRPPAQVAQLTDFGVVKE
jgi:hypothetical protein